MRRARLKTGTMGGNRTIDSGLVKSRQWTLLRQGDLAVGHADTKA